MAYNDHGAARAAQTPRIEDDRFLRGRGRFVANLPAPDAVHAGFVRSPVAHGRLDGVDVTAAAAMPGVVAVFTAADLDLAPIRPEPEMLHQAMVRHYLATDVVRFVGEPVAMVLAETETAVLDAMEQVVVDLHPLEAVVDARQALLDEVVLHPEAGTNVAMRLDATGEWPDDAEVTVAVSMTNPRVAMVPLEGRSILASWQDGACTVHVSAQGPHPHRERLAPALGVAPEAVRVVCPDVGGGFGSKAYPDPEEVLVAWAARRAGRPVRWVEDRGESMAALGHGRAQHQQIDLAGRRDGTIEAVRMHVVQDAGAYPRLGAFLPHMTRTVLAGPYRLNRVWFDASSVVTNTNPVVAYRGAGQPEAAAAMERAVDRFAHQVGLDPIEVRRRNLVAADSFPHTNASGLVHDSGDYEAGLDVLVERLDVAGWRKEQQRRRQSRDQRAIGLGVALFIEACSASNHHEHARVRVRADGSVQVWSGTSPYGQGHATTWAMLVAEELGVAVSDVEVYHGDSAWFPTGTVTGGSRSVQVGGVAVRDAALAVLEEARQAAATLLEASDVDVVYDRASRVFHVAGAPVRSVPLTETAGRAPGGCLDRQVRFDPEGATVSSGAYGAVVEVDLETGGIAVLRFVAVDDAGVVVNAPLFEGQVHGGVVQGLGQALWEEVRYDTAGNLRTANLLDYAVPTSAEVPWIETAVVQTPSPRNALGAKGVGESGPIGAVPAVHNAVVDAVAHLGIDHLDLPLTPERLWRAGLLRE